MPRLWQYPAKAEPLLAISAPVVVLFPPELLAPPAPPIRPPPARQAPLAAPPLGIGPFPELLGQPVEVLRRPQRQAQGAEPPQAVGPFPELLSRITDLLRPPARRDQGIATPPLGAEIPPPELLSLVVSQPMRDLRRALVALLPQSPTPLAGAVRRLRVFVHHRFLRRVRRRL